MKRGGPLPRRTPLRAGDKPLRVDPADYTAEQRRRNTTLTSHPDDDPRAAQFRQAVWNRDRFCTLPGYFGMTCGGGHDVHHVIPRLVAPELVYDPDNGTLLCRVHHDCLQDHRVVDRAYAVGVLGRNGDRVYCGRVVSR